MHILFLSHRVPYPPNKGEKIRTFHQIQYLTEKGHRIAVCAPLESDRDRGDLDALQKRYCDQTFSAPKPGRTSLVEGFLTGRALSVCNFYSRSLQQQLDAFLEANDIDVIVCTSSSMAEYVFRSTALDRSGRSRPRLVMDFMDLDSDKWRQYQKLRSFPLSAVFGREANLIARYERKIHESFDACIFISQAEVDLFLENETNLGKLHVVANGLDTTTFRPALAEKPETGPIMLFTGVMDYLPNEDAVIWFVENAWTEIRERYPNAMFYIAGMNPSSKVSALAEHPGVIVTGFVDDIMPYFDKAHIFVAPFRLARGVQNKVLQAFACGLPTITTRMGCEGINCQNGEHVLVADTIPEVVRQIDWIQAHPDAAVGIGRNAAALMQREYSWSGKLASLETIIGADQSISGASLSHA